MEVDTNSSISLILGLTGFRYLLPFRKYCQKKKDEFLKLESDPELNVKQNATKTSKRLSDLFSRKSCIYFWGDCLFVVFSLAMMWIASYNEIFTSKCIFTIYILIYIVEFSLFYRFVFLYKLRITSIKDSCEDSKAAIKNQ